MDSSITIKPSHAAVGKSLATRDPVTVREAVETDLDRSKTVASAGDGGSRQNEQRGDHQRGDHAAHDHPPQDLLADPESRDVLYRERDVRAAERTHPDQALLRQRAYRPAHPAPADGAATPTSDPHANIKA